MIAINMINEYVDLLEKRSELNKEIEVLVAACIEGSADIADLDQKLNEYYELVNLIVSFNFE